MHFTVLVMLGNSFTKLQFNSLVEQCRLDHIWLHLDAWQMYGNYLQSRHPSLVSLTLLWCPSPDEVAAIQAQLCIRQQRFTRL